jgi:hypothetical protein
MPREYARIKAAGAWLARREAEQALLWGRPASSASRPRRHSAEDLRRHLWLDTAPADREQLRRLRGRANPPSVLDRMTEILAVLRDAWSLLFSALVGYDRRRAEIV